MKQVTPNVQPPPFPAVKSDQIASEQTLFQPPPPRGTTLEDARLRQQDERDLYVIRVMDRVKAEPAPGNGLYLPPALNILGDDTKRQESNLQPAMHYGPLFFR